MGCFKNKEAVDNANVLLKLYDKKKVLSLMASNNWYSLKKTRQGTPSKLYNQLLRVTHDELLALKLKSSIYEHTFLNEPDLNLVKLKGEQTETPIHYTITGIKMAVVAEARNMSVSRYEDDKLVNVKKDATNDNRLITNERGKVIKLINDVYGKKIARFDSKTSDGVIIELSDAVAERMLKIELAKEVQRQTTEAAKAIKAYNEEMNTKDAPVDDTMWDGSINEQDHLNYDLSDFSDSLSTNVNEFFMNFKKFAVIHNHLDCIFNVVGFAGIIRDEGIKRVFSAEGIVICGDEGRIFHIILRQIAEELADEIKGIRFAIGGDMTNARNF